MLPMHRRARGGHRLAAPDPVSVVRRGRRGRRCVPGGQRCTPRGHRRRGAGRRGCLWRAVTHGGMLGWTVRIVHGCRCGSSSRRGHDGLRGRSRGFGRTVPHSRMFGWARRVDGCGYRCRSRAWRRCRTRRRLRRRLRLRLGRRPGLCRLRLRRCLGRRRLRLVGCGHRAVAHRRVLRCALAGGSEEEGAEEEAHFVSPSRGRTETTCIIPACMW